MGFKSACERTCKKLVLRKVFTPILKTHFLHRSCKINGVLRMGVNEVVRNWF